MEDHVFNAAKTIVLVEDDDLVRLLISRVLERGGYTVLGATSGEEGLELLAATDSADLLLTDMTLPGELNGLELGRRALEDYGDLKLVCMSGYGEEDLADDLLGVSGGAAFIAKPFSPNDLLEKVNELLDG